jgi:hypothetical protein
LPVDRLNLALDQPAVAATLVGLLQNASNRRAVVTLEPLVDFVPWHAGKRTRGGGVIGNPACGQQDGDDRIAGIALPGGGVVVGADLASVLRPLDRVDLVP